jgi:hypothetical protein
MLMTLALQAAHYWPASLYVPPNLVTPRMLLFALSTQQVIEGL